MKLKHMLFSMILSLSVLATAQADQKQLANLTAEAEPGKTSTMGIMVDDDNSITHFYFHPMGQKIIKYSPEQLANYKTLVYKSGNKVVQVKSVASGTKFLKIAVKYIKSVVTGEVGVRVLLIKYNRNINEYQILDEDSRPFTKAHILSHKNILGVTTGIEAIQTQQ